MAQRGQREVAVPEAHAAAEEIASVLFRFGEERHSRRIARAICDAREKTPLRTTRQLVEIVERSVPRTRRRKDRAEKHPATRTFQAIRIFINSELEELEAALEQSLSVLAPGGRLVAISFHSLEDRIVKRFMRNRSKPAPADTGFPEEIEPLLEIIGKPRRPGDDEVQTNPRARSAVLRVAEKRS